VNDGELQEPFHHKPTMMKLSDVIDDKPRGLVCVNCGASMTWRIYSLNPEKFDEECPVCKVTANQFWNEQPKGKSDGE